MEKILFFDLDDTLYRRSAPFTAAYRRYFANAGIDLSVEAAERAFRTTQERCEEVFPASQRGEITKDEMNRYRYRQGFADVGVALTAEEALRFRDVYAEEVTRIRPEPAVLRLLDACKAHYGRLGILSNGQRKHQLAKIESLGLKQWVDEELILISGDIGIDKPDVRIFRYAETLCGALPEQIALLGDNPAVDIAGAENAGWHAVLWQWQRAEEITSELCRHAEGKAQKKKEY